MKLSMMLEFFDLLEKVAVWSHTGKKLLEATAGDIRDMITGKEFVDYPVVEIFHSMECINIVCKGMN